MCSLADGAQRSAARRRARRSEMLHAMSAQRQPRRRSQGVGPAAAQRSLTFSEPEIQALFGHEAAEDEDPARLREYYFKSSTYDQVVTDLPLRILVGHKGIGKSALFQIAIGEETEAGRLTLTIKPDDVLDLGDPTNDFLKTVRTWKNGLLRLLADKAADSFGYSEARSDDRSVPRSGDLLSFITAAIVELRQARGAAAGGPIAEAFLNKPEISVYVDDLDRGWQGRPHDVGRISALLSGVRDIVNEIRGVRFRISLRSDVYFLVRTADESTDKLEGSVVWHTWTNHEIFALLVKRIETFFGRSVDLGAMLDQRQRRLAMYLDPVFEDRFRGTGHWSNAPTYRVLMSLVRKRPRDLVKLCSLAGRDARKTGNRRIETNNLESVFEEYSQGRIQDTINEFRSELPDIDRLLFGMKPSRRERQAKEGYVYTTSGLVQKLGNVQESGTFEFTGGRRANSRDLAAFLYKINFLTARKETAEGLIERRYFEESRYLQNSFVEFGFDWEIHPAYRWALQPEDPRSIFNSLRLSDEND